ncbi:hypothetical protein C7B69_09865 [filamentous cyanobacterium Phorm 46]|nr:hypothetical protein C7B69_09865 [filamentous cyanobacterium Phorm 46]PSB53186.1 hypothetical protein C7B67_03895 [filamentous cyanobacterium Phorm 6]
MIFYLDSIACCSYQSAPLPTRIGLKPEPLQGEIIIRLFITPILGLLLSSAVNLTIGSPRLRSGQAVNCQLSTVNCQLNKQPLAKT